MSPKTSFLQPRDRNGQFGGAGAYPVSEAAQKTRFTPLAEAGDQLSQALQAADFALNEAPRNGDGVPTVIVRASPGSGKSTGQRKLMAARNEAGESNRIAFHVPTLSLAEEAAQEAAASGLSAQAIRGRSAKRPDGTGLMCEKAETVERASRLGISVKDNFCKRIDEHGNVTRCCHFNACAYLGQFEDRTSHRFLATAYFKLPNPDAAKPDQRVLDETFWREFIQIIDVEEEHFCTKRTSPICEQIAAHAELLQASKDIFAALVDGRGPMSLKYDAQEFRAFAALEREAKPVVPDIAPEQNVRTQNELLEAYELKHRTAARFAAVWDVLADAKQKDLAVCERLRLYRRDGKHVLRVLRKKELPHKEPLLVLDADADRQILSALGCDVIRESDLSLRPNAIIEQLHDRRMPTTTLLGSKTIREEWRRIVTREALRDRLGANTGVLVGATKKVVRAFFEDAGYSFQGISEAEATDIMLNTDLHGASWTWFGGRSLGINRYEKDSTCIIIGREELPIHALEDQGRALFGDAADAPLDLVHPDAMGRQVLPEEEVSYEMTDGSAMAVMVPCHPDTRIRRLQIQSREAATRQLIERLRLARAKEPKRVLIGCNIPLPGVPVDALVSWQNLCVERLESAIVYGLLESGGVRSTYAGLATAAPHVFESEDAVKSYLKRNPAKKALFQKLKASLGQGSGKWMISLEHFLQIGQSGKLTALLFV